MIEFEWKPVTEIPTEHREENNAVSPTYLVKCGTSSDGLPIIGYSCYSYATNGWMACYRATEQGIHRVTEWSDVKL